MCAGVISSDACVPGETAQSVYRSTSQSGLFTNHMVGKDRGGPTTFMPQTTVQQMQYVYATLRVILGLADLTDAVLVPTLASLSTVVTRLDGSRSHNTVSGPRRRPQRERTSAGRCVVVDRGFVLAAHDSPACW